MAGGVGGPQRTGPVHSQPLQRQDREATGDGILGLFDGAERAVRAAAALQHEVAALGIQLRAGIHTGEVEVVPGDVRGVAIHAAARVMALAEPGETLVSSTTRDLLDGTGLDFDDRGSHVFKGLPGKRAVFALKPVSTENVRSDSLGPGNLIN